MANLRLHHVNVTSDDMSILTRFYQDALGLEMLPSPPMIATSASGTTDGDEAWDDAAKFFNAGDPNELQLHATQRQPYLAAQEGHSVNPLISGHFAFRTDDIEDVMARLTANGIPFDDWGIWSVKGWHQIFLTDPAGNMVEIHQVKDDVEP
ncbi:MULTISPECIES: VOC family protein [unclassified Rathayibacter]|uniref:VOC family protein n=1 Tax=unclassified Rathayibacter TaxID=2609250 RepID=UPI0007022913|nr:MULTISPECIES: VOC family protein [unclassified Rathayibacter]KQQ01280.1 glyoxalase [Rathayibacter sp. Leaf294]KQS11311.1 glyoxalase [Rathayibacter sp. Leaf185]